MTIRLAETKRPLRMTRQLLKLLLSATAPLRLQLRLWRRLRPPPLPELWAVHCNKYTGLQYAVPTRVRMRFGPPPYSGNLNIACDIVCDAASMCRSHVRCRIRSGTYDIVRPTYDVVGTYDIVHRTSDVRCRRFRHRTYDIIHTTSYVGTYDVVGVRCRTCPTYDVVRHIDILRCRTSDVRHRRLVRIQMQLDHPRKICIMHFCTKNAKYKMRISVCMVYIQEFQVVVIRRSH